MRMLHGLIRRNLRKRKSFLPKKACSGDLSSLPAGVPQPKAIEDLSRRVRAIERVEMNSASFVLEEIVTLL